MTFLFYSNGSVIPRVLIKIDAQSQISQWQLVEFMNETLKSGMLGQYQVDPTSVELTGINFIIVSFSRQAPSLYFSFLFIIPHNLSTGDYLSLGLSEDFGCMTIQST